MLKCTKCSTPLEAEFFNTLEINRCYSCGAFLQTEVFPAFFRKTTVESGEALLTDDEAGCFYHPGKKAVLPCSFCGRFLCALCDLELDGRHLCPDCIEKGKRKSKIRNLENHRVLYDNIALYLAIVPMLFVFPTIVTAPAVFFVAIRYWNAAESIIPRARILRFVAAIILAGIQIIGWLGVLYVSITT
ncbi:hypothetical protein QUF80_15960 [Desulfococcaceae bacterium HSG8]|nr:hypothetical protein [Desulfococcaceae bacterium HSG8]